MDASIEMTGGLLTWHFVLPLQCAPGSAEEPHGRVSILVWLPRHPLKSYQRDTKRQ